MNRSERNYYEHLLQQGIDPTSIRYIDSGVPDFTYKGNRVIVKKRYGGRIILHSDVEESFIDSGGESDWVAIMRDNPDEGTDPLCVVPLHEVSSAGDGIGQDVVEEYADGEVEEYFGTLQVTLANRNEKTVELGVSGELLSNVEDIAESEPEFDNPDQVMRAAIRDYVSKKQDYGEAT